MKYAADEHPECMNCRCYMPSMGKEPTGECEAEKCTRNESFLRRERSESPTVNS